MKRERLPDRRAALTASTDWHGKSISVCVGFARDGRPLEVFARAGTPDSDLDCVVDDVAVVVSRAIQHGDDLKEISRGIGRLPNGEPSSLAGAILDAAVKLSAE